MDIKKLKDKIEEAKEKLGYEQASIIGEGANFDQWDSKHKKACCPFPEHEDDTPSFVWFPQGNCYKCFGCNRTMDIIDYYMRFESCNFIQAAQKLIKRANMRFDFSVDSFKQQYKYPTPETNTERSQVEAYMAKRKISPQTLDKLGVKQDKNGNVVFEYRNIFGQLMLVKYRPSRKVKKGENKTWCQSGADTTPLLWNMDKTDITKPLYIVEGEPDLCAMVESGIDNVVSVPLGAGNLKWIDESWEWLENFEKIVLWFDEDEAGYKAIKEISKRLGEERIYIARCVYKDESDPEKNRYNDINEQLLFRGKESVYNSAINAKRVPLSDLTDLADVEEFDITNAEFISTGIKSFDKYLGGGWIVPSVHVFTGQNSSGKSTIINQMMIAEPLNAGYNCFVFSGELTKSQLRNWIEYPLCGKGHTKEIEKNGQTYHIVDKHIKEMMRDWYKGRCHIYDNEDDYSADSVLKAMEKCAKRYGTKVFVLDNLMMIDLQDNGKDRLKKEREFMLRIKRFAKKYNCVIHLVAHPRKTEGIQRLTKMDISGSGDLTNLPEYVSAIYRFTKKDKAEMTEEGLPEFENVIDLFKNRPLGFQDLSIGLMFDYPSKRFYTSVEEQYKTYGWCKNPLPIPDQAHIDFDAKMNPATPFDEED